MKFKNDVVLKISGSYTQVNMDGMSENYKRHREVYFRVKTEDLDTLFEYIREAVNDMIANDKIFDDIRIDFDYNKFLEGGNE